MSQHKLSNHLFCHPVPPETIQLIISKHAFFGNDTCYRESHRYLGQSYLIYTSVDEARPKIPNSFTDSLANQPPWSCYCRVPPSTWQSAWRSSAAPVTCGWANGSRVSFWRFPKFHQIKKQTSSSSWFLHAYAARVPGTGGTGGKPHPPVWLRRWSAVQRGADVHWRVRIGFGEEAFCDWRDWRWSWWFTLIVFFFVCFQSSTQSCVFHVFTFNNKTVRVSLSSEEPLRSLTGNMTIYGIRWANWKCFAANKY